MQRGRNALRDYAVLEPCRRHHDKLSLHELAAADLSRRQKIVGCRNRTDG
jgi:hypothetical protein